MAVRDLLLGPEVTQFSLHQHAENAIIPLPSRAAREMTEISARTIEIPENTMRPRAIFFGPKMST
jgi:hypothetical protein